MPAAGGCALGDVSRLALGLLGWQGGFGSKGDIVLSIAGLAPLSAITDRLARSGFRHADTVGGKGRQSTAPLADHA
jgi:hypothetical protein